MTYQDMLERGNLEPVLPFSQAEYDRRVSDVRDKMRGQGIEVLLVTNTSNWCYLTGYDSMMPSCYATGILPLEGDLSIHTAELELTCVMYNSTVKDIIVYDWADSSRRLDQQLVDVLLERGHAGKTIGVELGFPEPFAIGALDARTYQTLKDGLPDATFVDASHLVLDVRVIKQPAEIEMIRTAGKFTWAGLKAALDAAGEGKTDNDVAAAGYAAMIAAGSENLSIPGFVLTGFRSGIGPHLPFKRERLQMGDAVYLEFAANFNRYNAPSMRSAVIGAPSDSVRRLTEAALETVDLLIENIAPGRTSDDVAKAARKGLEPVLDEIYFQGGYGYSIGLGMQPTWTDAAMYITEGDERELKPGMTFHFPIALIKPLDCCIGFSETVAVTERGCEVLTPAQARELVVR
jgi:Xaa-Pro dipeptidase